MHLAKRKILEKVLSIYDTLHDYDIMLDEVKEGT